LDILLTTLQEAGIPILVQPDPELQGLIDDELGLPPVIEDLSTGVLPTSDDAQEDQKAGYAASTAECSPRQ